MVIKYVVHLFCTRTAPALRLLDAASCRRYHSLRRNPQCTRKHCPSHRVRHFACMMQARARRCHSVRVTVIEHMSHRVVHPQRLLTLSALALRLLRQARSNAITGSPQQLSCNEALVSPLSGRKRLPFGQSILIPTLHPRRASPASPVGRGRGPAAAAVAVASLPCVRRPRLSPLPPLSGRCRSSAAESRRGSLDAPRRVSTLAYASGIPPALQKVSFVVLSCVLLLVLMRYSSSLPSNRQQPSGALDGFIYVP